jgi:hypothetical protein
MLNLGRESGKDEFVNWRLLMLVMPAMYLNLKHSHFNLPAPPSAQRIYKSR